MKRIDLRKVLFDYFNVVLGCILSAFAITSILKSNGLITGGIVGISIILDKVTGMYYTYIYYALSLIVLVSAWISIGKREGLKGR